MQQQIMKLLSQYKPPTMPNSAYLGSALSGKPSYVPQLDPAATASYYQQAVTTPLLRQFDQTIAPRIREGFAGVGAFSSREGDTLGRALGDTQAQINSGLGQAQMDNQRLLAQMTQSGYENAANRQLQAYGQLSQNALNFSQAPLQAAGAFSGINQQFSQIFGQQQQYQQQRQDAAAQAKYQEFLRTLPESSPWLKYALSYIGTNQSTIVNKQGWMQDILGGLGAGISGISGLGALAGGIGGGLQGIGNMIGENQLGNGIWNLGFGLGGGQ